MKPPNGTRMDEQLADSYLVGVRARAQHKDKRHGHRRVLVAALQVERRGFHEEGSHNVDNERLHRLRHLISAKTPVAPTSRVNRKRREQGSYQNLTLGRSIGRPLRAPPKRRTSLLLGAAGLRFLRCYNRILPPHRGKSNHRMQGIRMG